MGTRPAARSARLVGFAAPRPLGGGSFVGAGAFAPWTPAAPYAGLRPGPPGGELRFVLAALERVRAEPAGLGRDWPPPGALPRLGLLPVSGAESPWGLALAARGAPLLWLAPEADRWTARIALDEGPRAGTPPRAADLDADGAPELWWPAPEAADGEDAARAFPPPGSPLDTTITPSGLDLGGGFTALVLWDLNGDEREDILLAGPQRPAAVLLNEGELGFRPGAAAPRGRAGGLEARRLVLGPEVRGHQWALAWARDGLLLLERELPQGAFRPAARQPRGLPDAALDARIDDFDGDGRVELLALGPRALLRLPLPPPAGEEAARLPVAGALALAAGDLDGDARPDLVVARRGAAPLVLLADRASPARAAVALRGPDERPHALGATVRLRDAAGRDLWRVRWPPQEPGDQPCLFVPVPETNGVELIVTWPDGNATEQRPEVGRHRTLRPEG